MSESNLLIREALPSDLTVLLEFEQGVVAEERPFNDAIREQDVTYYDLPGLMSDPDASLQLAERDGRIVACGYVWLRKSNPAFTHRRHAYLGFMYVEPDARGQGINKQIVDSLIAWSLERNVDDFYLEVYAGNAAAVRAYEKAGFEPLLVEMKLSSKER